MATKKSSLKAFVGLVRPWGNFWIELTKAVATNEEEEPCQIHVGVVVLKFCQRLKKVCFFGRPLGMSFKPPKNHFSISWVTYTSGIQLDFGCWFKIQTLSHKCFLDFLAIVDWLREITNNIRISTNEEDSAVRMGAWDKPRRNLFEFFRLLLGGGLRVWCLQIAQSQQQQQGASSSIWTGIQTKTAAAATLFCSVSTRLLMISC